MSPNVEKNLVLLLKTTIIFLIGLGAYFFLHNFWPFLASIFRTGVSVILPFFLSFLIATFLNPVITFFEKRMHFSRTTGTLVALILFILLIGGLLFLILTNLIDELIDLSQSLASYSEEIKNWNLDLFLSQLSNFLMSLKLPQEVVQEATSSIWKVFEFLQDMATLLLKQIFYLAASLPKYFVLLVIAFVATFFWARDYQIVNHALIKLLPQRWQSSFIGVSGNLIKIFWGFLRVEVFLITLTGLQSLLGFLLIGVSYAHLLALVVAMLDLLPVVGPGLLFIPWGLWSLFTGKTGFGIGLLLLYGIIVIVRQILEPKVIGQTIGLHPLTTLAAIYFGFSLLGIWGAILVPAIIVIYKAFLEGGGEL